MNNKAENKILASKNLNELLHACLCESFNSSYSYKLECLQYCAPSEDVQSLHLVFHIYDGDEFKWSTVIHATDPEPSDFTLHPEDHDLDNFTYELVQFRTVKKLYVRSDLDYTNHFNEPFAKGIRVLLGKDELKACQISDICRCVLMSKVKDLEVDQDISFS